MELLQRFKKDSQDADTVVLVPSTTLPEGKPNHLKIDTSITVEYGAGGAPADFWGTAVTDDVEYLVSIKRAT